MKLVAFMKQMNLAEEQEQAILRLATRRFGLLPTQAELLKIDKNGWVYPQGYRELAIHWDILTEPVFKEVI
jgi:hypothetical protein